MLPPLIPDLVHLRPTPSTRLRCNLVATGPLSDICWHNMSFVGLQSGAEPDRPVIHIITQVGNSKFVYADKVRYLAIFPEPVAGRSQL